MLFIPAFYFQKKAENKFFSLSLSVKFSVMKVTKYSGEIVTFEKEKLKKSLFKSGACEADVNRVLETIEKQLYDGIPTKKIYKLAFQLLKKFPMFMQQNII